MIGGDVFLVLDAGSGGAKAFLVDMNGGILRSSFRRWERDEWKPEASWRLICEAVRDAVLRSGVDPSRISGVSCTSMREEYVLLDAENRGVSYEMTEESLRHGEETLMRHGERMYDSSGHWPVPNWIAGAILPWLNDEKKGVLADVRHFLMVSDWVNYCLTGDAATEGSSACETALFDVRLNDWAWTLMDELSLPKSIFPPVLRSGEELGEVTSEASTDTGLPPGTPVFMGGADTQCGLIGMGVTEGEAAAVGGTTTPVQLVTDEPVFDSRRRTWTNMHVEPGRWILESNAGYTGQAYRWVRDNYGECPDYETLNGLASKVPVGSNGLYAYLGAHVFDAGPPYWSQDHLGDTPIQHVVIGLKEFSAGELARAVLESNCYAVRANLERLSSVAGLEFPYLKFCGGNSRSGLWVQIQADVLGVPVVVPRCSDGTAVGTAVCAAVGSGAYRGFREAVEGMVRLMEPVHPRMESHREYGRLYEMWLRLREGLPDTL
ncbi:hypothetical protein JXL21_07400 [Candidatus Bathyarchaeota archaeon]|nr:hypothetical protein [Candidatus Bathyarchaeota archaeon]